MDVLISQAGFFLIMADHDDRHIGMLPHFLEPFPDDLAIRFIQGARHFIEQEDFPDFYSLINQKVLETLIL